MDVTQDQSQRQRNEESKTVSLLRSLHCCQRCVLRYLGWRINSVYSNPSESFPNLWNQEVEQDERASTEEPSESEPAGSAQESEGHVTGDASCERGQVEPQAPELQARAVGSRGTGPHSVTGGSPVTAGGSADGGKTAAALTESLGTSHQECEMDDAGSEAVTSSDEQSRTCPACLGILQELCSKEFVEKICLEVKALEYDFSTFMFSVTLPLQLEIRQHFLLSYLNAVCKSSLKSSDITPVKDVFKWVCGPLMRDQFLVPFSPKSHFEVGVTFEEEETHKEVDILYEEIIDKEPSSKRRRFGRSHSRKEGPTRHIIVSALNGLSDRHLKRLLPYPPTVPKGVASYSIECLHEPVYFAGRYTKHSRHLSQTPWILDGERKTESSVEELVCNPLKEHLRATDYKFCSSGREDVDVRTLGRGRPFVAEMVNPRRCVLSMADCRQLQEVVNQSTSDIGVNDLQIVGKDAHQKLKEGETEKKKSYVALVRVTSEVSLEQLGLFAEKKEVVLEQKTPLRVLHRRPLATRQRTIHSMRTERVDGHHFRLFLCTQAGTYIKEFVHGDLGRTQPNVGTLLNTDADILELDVTAVHVDWPKMIDD